MELNFVKKTITNSDIGKTALIEVDTNKINKWEDGEIINGKFKQNRRYSKLKAYWASCEMVSQHRQPDYEYLDTKEAVDYYCRIKSGLVEMTIITPTETIIKAKSISYDKMPDEQEFEDYFYKGAIPIMEKISNIPAHDILCNWSEYTK